MRINCASRVGVDPEGAQRRPARRATSSGPGGLQARSSAGRRARSEPGLQGAADGVPVRAVSWSRSTRTPADAGALQQRRSAGRRRSSAPAPVRPLRRAGRRRERSAARSSAGRPAGAGRTRWPWARRRRARWATAARRAGPAGCGLGQPPPHLHDQLRDALGQRLGQIAAGAVVGQHPIAARPLHGRGQRPRPGDGVLERAGVALGVLLEQVQVGPQRVDAPADGHGPSRRSAASRPAAGRPPARRAARSTGRSSPRTRRGPAARAGRAGPGTRRRRS